MFTKNHIMCNAYARINCTSSIDTVVKFLDYRSSLKKNTYKIGLIPIIIWYACKVLFSGVFYTGSIFQDGGIVMDENGRNGWKWHLAQQITQLVIMRILSITTTSTTCNHATMHILFITVIITQMGGIFISLIKIKKFPHTLL